MQVCAGMRFLQDSAGIVHRDLKPENILLTTDGIAKVTDFGLVQTGLPTMLRSAAESSGGVVDIALTTDGVIAGSIPYMAPEQFLGARADVRSDVYAFGVVLYELLSGRRPFHAADFAGYRRCHLEEPPAPLTELEDVSSDVGDIVMTCLTKNPEDRFQDFGALSGRIGNVLRRRGLESLIPPTISPEVLESRMTAIDWEGRGQSLLTIGETSVARQGRENARPFLERAHYAYQRALGLPGHTASVHGATGTVLWLLDRHDDAVVHFHEQLRVDRSDRRAHVGLARNLVRLGQVDDALGLLDNARAALGDDGSFEEELFNIRARRQGGAAVFDVSSSSDSAAESRPSLRQRVTSWFGRRRHKDTEIKALLRSVRLELAGWQEDIEQPACRVWRDAQDNILTLTVVTDNLGGLLTGDVVEVRRWARAIAENAGAGLIEARTIARAAGDGAALIYKSRRDFGFLFTGMLFWFGQISGVWTMMSRDSDMHAGNREATVSAELLNSSQLTRQEYERSWAQDPYDPTYTGVARNVLRCLSDSEQYDARFPDHPLSQIRKVLNQLPPVSRAS